MLSTAGLRPPTGPAISRSAPAHAVAVLLDRVEDRGLRGRGDFPVVVRADDISAHGAELANTFLSDRERFGAVLHQGRGLHPAAETEPPDGALADPLQTIAIRLQRIEHVDAHLQKFVYQPGDIAA